MQKIVEICYAVVLIYIYNINIYKYNTYVCHAIMVGCELLVYPSAFNMTTGPAHWELLTRARASDNQLYIAMVSPARDETASYIAWGHSNLANPWWASIYTSSLDNPWWAPIYRSVANLWWGPIDTSSVTNPWWAPIYTATWLIPGEPPFKQ